MSLSFVGDANSSALTLRNNTCGKAIAAQTLVPGFGASTALVASNSSATATFGSAQAAELASGERFQICWSSDPVAEPTYRVAVGSLFLAGPKPLAEAVSCHPFTNCSITLVGKGLTSLNQIFLASDSLCNSLVNGTTAEVADGQASYFFPAAELRQGFRKT